MRPKNIRSKTTVLALSLFLGLTSLLPGAATPTGQLLKQIGSGAATSWGDYVSSAGGLNTYYSYYVEVPPGTARIDIGIFDADVGMGTPGNNDWTNDTYNTTCNYRVFRPDGTQAVSRNGTATGPAGSNNAWYTLYGVNNPAAGHWEVRVNMSSSVTTGNEMNGYGIRVIASDGRDLNIYAHSFVPVGCLGTGVTQSTTLYPYIVTGCSIDFNDWDGDNVPPGTILCTCSFTSRNGTYTSTFNGSGSTVWSNVVSSGFTTNYMASDLGIWRSVVTYTDTGANSNYGVFYLGNSNASNPPPTAQPQANTFRVYFPKNSGGAPVKPVLTHDLAHVSGPNPPTMGQTTRIKVQAVIYNPTPFAITFSASNLLTANIPGSSVVYAGNAAVSQGSIASQPASGGTGTITWNPGSVAGSGNYETLSYQLDVTPASAGQIIMTTGTTAANGTTARFVDETGNTTQTRATCTLGPLCELILTEGLDLPTLATISTFKAYGQGGQTVVHWETASENGTIGFNLFRKDKAGQAFSPVNREFLPGLLSAPQGGVYRVIDPTATSGRTYTYKLVEIEASGREFVHGPFTLAVKNGDDASRLSTENFTGGYSKQPHRMSLTRLNKAKEDRYGVDLARTRDNTRKGGALKIGLKDKGLYYLGAAIIADILAVPQATVIDSIRNLGLALLNQGKPVAWLPVEDNAGLYFYGQDIDSIYTAENVYWLNAANGLLMGSEPGGLPAPGTGNEVFVDRVTREENRLAMTALFDDPESDYWLWDYVSGNSSKSFAFPAPGAAAQGNAQLTVFLKGGSDVAANPDHRVLVKINGTQVGSGKWDGMKEHKLRVSFNQSLLNDGINTLELTGVLGSGVSASIFYLDSFTLDYNRYYRAVDDRLWCRGDNNGVITVSGFFNPAIRVFNVTDPRQPKVVQGITTGPGNRVSFVPAAPDNVYLVITSNGLSTPPWIRGDKPSNLKKRQNAADYIIIAGDGLQTAAAALANLRQGTGLSTRVVEVEDIYDEFNYGLAGPQAIKNFLTYAYKNWQAPQVKYVVLAGEGTYDYKNYLGFSDNLVPPLMKSTPFGIFASDSALGDVQRKDGVPEIAIGRLPVLTAAELDLLVEKIGDYPYAGGAWTRKVLMLADNPDQGGQFPTDADSLATLVPPGYSVEKIYLPDFATIDTARQKLLTAFNQGALLIQYIGHAGMDRLAAEGLLKSADVASLQNEDRLPILAAMTCVVNRFEIPGYDTLSEALMLRQGGGTVAVFAPSGASLNSLARDLADRFFRALFQGQENILGKAILKAMKDYAELGNPAFMLSIYNLLGDPGLELK